MVDALWEIDSTLKERGFSLSLPPAVYIGNIFVHGIAVRVEINVPDFTFVTLPIVRLVDGSSLPLPKLAHLADAEGHICYVGQGGLILDQYNPGGSVLRVLKECEEALSRSFRGGAAVEFEAELASYWNGSPILFCVGYSGDSHVSDARLVLQKEGESPNKRMLVVPVDQEEWRAYESLSDAKVLHFSENLQSKDGISPKTLSEALTFIESQKSPPQRWRENLLDATARFQSIFLASPNAVVGWLPKFPRNLQVFKNKKGGVRESFLRNEVEKRPDEIQLNRLVGLRADLKFCVERNLFGKNTLIGKKVVLVGCGTLGSVLAKLLVQSGAGCDAKFLVYDDETLSAGNIGRHLLGFEDLWKPKALAVAEKLRGFHPSVSVEGRRKNALEDWEVLRASEIVIDATGDQNFSSALNDLFLSVRSRRNTPALLQCWVLGNGVAGQSFLNLHDEFGCYRCLKTSFGGAWRHNPLKDPGSDLFLAPASCAESGYVPFSMDASSATASLALRSVLDWANGSPGPRLRTLVFDPKNGKETKWASPSPMADCSACSNRR